MIRDQVAAVLSGADPTITAEFYPGDTVQVIVEDANLRSGPGHRLGYADHTALGHGPDRYRRRNHQ